MGRYNLKKKLAIFVSYNSKIGFGHIYRCMNFSNFFKKKIKFFFFINKKFSKLETNQYLFKIQKKNLEKIDEILKKENCKNILFDIDNQFYSKKHLLRIYDFFIKKKYQTICWDNTKNLKSKFAFVYRPYPKKVFQNAKLSYQKKIVGTDFFFYKIQKKFNFRKKISSIAIQLGGTKNLKLIKILTKYLFNKKIKIYFFTKNNSEINFLNKYKKNNIKIYNHSDFSNYANYIDFLICSGGVTKYEAASINMPSLAVCLNELQYNLNKNLNIKYGFLVCKKSDIIKKLDFIFSDKNIRLKLHNEAKKNFKNFSKKNIKKINSLLL